MQVSNSGTSPTELCTHSTADGIAKGSSYPAEKDAIYLRFTTSGGGHVVGTALVLHRWDVNLQNIFFASHRSSKKQLRKHP